jgi:enterochelin esterase-like enzyme
MGRVPRQGVRLLEPQATLFFVLLMVAFAGLLVWVALAKQIVFRVLAACLAFIPAMVFGIAAVNKYYDYYQTWGALFTDLNGQSSSIPHLSAASLRHSSPQALRTYIASSSNVALDAQIGYLFNTTVTGPRSHVSRIVYVYLPPQYFWKSYANYRFPGIELLHGSPGKPTAWIGAMDLIPIYQGLLASHKAKPAVLVMPDTDGGYQYSFQCLNDPHGLQDMTWVGQEVPNWVAANLRVEPPGPAWGIAGYSEGAFCAANIALQYPTRFSYSGVMSGYFNPTDSQVPAGGKQTGRPVIIDVFKGDYRLGLINTPDWYILHYPIGLAVPHFFLSAGSDDTGSLHASEYFRQELLTRDPNALPLDIIGGAHVASVWRTALTPLLNWMTNGVTADIRYSQELQAQARAAAAKQAAAAKAKAAKHKVHRLAPVKPV